MRVAITGVTGFIGRHLATRALETGQEVTAFSRRAWSGAPFVPLEDRHFLELPAWPDPDALANVDVVIHLAVAPQGADPSVTDAVNRLGSERLFDVAQRAGVSRFVFVSSQSAHADAKSAYGRSKYAVEQWLASEPGVVVVRPGMVHGDSSEGLVGRATSTAAKLRMFPVIGGRLARVQPIDVDTLSDALLAVARMDDPPRLLELANPTAEPLAGFLRHRTRERFGVNPLAIPVPLGLARAGVRLVSRLRLPSPISEENIDGIEAFVPMDTAADMALIAQQPDGGARVTVPIVEPRKLLLVGSGRIGLVHALTAAHHQGMVLAGIVDLNRSAMARLASFAGPKLPMFTDLDEAIAALRPDAAIIGTPPSSHVPLARKLLEAGIDVLVEKPVAASGTDRHALSDAVASHPDRYLATGYLAGVLPHLAAVAPDLRAGRFGSPLSFSAHAFVSRVEAGVAEQRDMWELDPEISGGGALVNLGVHVLAMIDVLLGPVEVDQATLVAQPGRTIEDGAALSLRAGGVAGEFSTAWHLPGFDMPENHLRIDTDRGYLVCTTSCAAFVGADGVHMVHQVDADRGFDLAPLDAGGAFWNEQDLLARRVAGSNSLAIAERIEALITGVYRTAERISAPRPARRAPVLAGPGGPASATMPDLRGAPPDIVRSWTGPALVGTESAAHDHSIVALPDAPGHFRTLTNKGALTLARELGVTPLGRAAFGVSPRGAATASGRPWEALLVLLRAELRRLPRSYRGALVVDAYLVDLATATGNISVIANALDDLRAHCAHARVGIEVNAVARLVPHVPAIASQLDLVVALGTTRAAGVDALRELLANTELIVKTGVLPSELLAIAWDDPEQWTFGRGSLVVHWPGAPGLRAAHADALARAKEAAGLSVTR